MDAQQVTAVYASYGHCLTIRCEKAIEDVSGLLQLFGKLLPILAAAFSQVPNSRWHHSCYGILGSIGGARGKLDSLPVRGKLSTGDNIVSSSCESVLLTLRRLYGHLLQASPFEMAELHLTIAQAIQTLFCLYLRAHGTSPEEHAFAKEEVPETNLFDLHADFSKAQLGSCWVIRAMNLLTGTHQPLQKKSQQGQLRSLTQKVKESY